MNIFIEEWKEMKRIKTSKERIVRYNLETSLEVLNPRTTEK